MSAMSSSSPETSISSAAGSELEYRRSAHARRSSPRHRCAAPPHPIARRGSRGCGSLRVGCGTAGRLTSLGRELGCPNHFVPARPVLAHHRRKALGRLVPDLEASSRGAREGVWPSPAQPRSPDNASGAPSPREERDPGGVVGPDAAFRDGHKRWIRFAALSASERDQPYLLGGKYGSKRMRDEHELYPAGGEVGALPSRPCRAHA